MREQFRVIIACGGTGGHVFPGLAVAEVLRMIGHTVILWVAGRKEEQAALEDWKGAVVTERGFQSPGSVRGVLAIPGMFPALFRCLKIMRRSRPDVLLAMGSYASVGPAFAARLLRIPLVLHEANAVPGRAIRLLRPLADTAAFAFEESARAMNHKRMAVTGMPLRNAMHDPGRANSFSKLKKEDFTVLVMGGSRGAHALNMIVSRTLVMLRGEGRRIQVIHLAGDSDAAFIRGVYSRHGVPNVVFGFLEEMETAYQRADFAISRAGASSCAELSHYGIPSLLVPYPLATRQHQLANALALERDGAADVREERELSEEWLGNYLCERMSDAAGLESMRRAARKRASGDAAAALAGLVEDAARRRLDAGKQTRGKEYPIGKC